MRRTTSLGLFAVLAAGCATVHPERDVQTINAILEEHGSEPVVLDSREDPDAAVRAWLAEPMTAERAVRVAILRSPRLEQEYARLGLARAEVLAAMQTGNPRVSAAWLTQEGGGSSQLTLAVGVDLADLLLLPSRVRMAALDRGRARQQVAAAILGVVTDVEEAWYTAVAADQVADLRATAADGMAASAELARRFYEAGNISELQLSRELAAASESRIAAARAAVESTRARMELNLVLGLGGAEAGWALDRRLALPVSREDDPVELARLASETNPTIVAARQERDVLTAAAKVRGALWLGGTAVGYERERELDGTVIHGPTVDVELPIFNQGQASSLQLQAQLADVRARVSSLELASSNAVGQSAERVRVSGEIVRIYQDGLLPQRRIATLRSQQEQSFMLIGVFELIQTKMAEYDALQAYVEALRDYWLARVDLMRAVGSRLPSDALVTGSAPTIDEIMGIAPATPGAPR